MFTINNFEKIKSDKNIIKLYNKISEFEDFNKGWAYHNLEHVENVTKIIELLLQALNYDKDFIEEAKIAAILIFSNNTFGVLLDNHLKLQTLHIPA